MQSSLQCFSGKNIQSIAVSAREYKNIPALQDALFEALTKDMHVPLQTDAVISSSRQYQHIQACIAAVREVRNAAVSQNSPLDMISLDIDTALRELGAITGMVTSEDILDIMFSSFCTGK